MLIGKTLPAVPTEVIKRLAPTGMPRAALNLANAVLVQKNAATGEPRGVTAAVQRAFADSGAVKGE